MKNNSLNINRLSLYVLGFLVCGLFGCDIDDEPIPAYLEIKPFILEETDPGTHGSVSHKITNGRITFTDQTDGSIHSLGTVTLPTTIPVLVTGQQEITIDPVIKGGGNSFFLEIYPFYERFQQVLDLPPNGDVVVQPVTRYADNAVFEFIESFEGTGHRFQEDLDGNENTFIEISSEDVFEGNSSGKISLDTGNILMVAATTDFFNFNFSEAGRVFMELNYKNEVPMEFGVQAINNIGQAESIFEFAVLPKDEWNKIYFNLTDIMTSRTEQNFTFIFRTGIPIEEGSFIRDKATVYIDNIKVVHF